MAQSDSSHEHQTRPIIQHTTGGISLGAYKRIEQMGDLVAGNKISIVVYTGPAQPPDHAARQVFEHAYRSEIIARYAVWRERYVRLPMQATVREDTGAVSGPFFEREDFVFAALSARLTSASAGIAAPPAVPLCVKGYNAIVICCCLDRLSRRCLELCSMARPVRVPCSPSSVGPRQQSRPAVGCHTHALCIALPEPCSLRVARGCSSRPVPKQLW
jgi:hypothetical protein